MCDCFARADVEIQDFHPRYAGEPTRRRISFVRDKEPSYHDDTYYARPRSSGNIVIVRSRPSTSGRSSGNLNLKRSTSRERSPEYKAPPKITYPKQPTAFVPLPAKIPDRPLTPPERSVVRNRKGKHRRSGSSQSIVVYTPKRGRRERKYYVEDEDEDSDVDSWVGGGREWEREREREQEWDVDSDDSWAIAPIKHYSDVRRKRGSSRGRR